MEYAGKEEDRKVILSSGFELDQYLSSKTLMWRISGLGLPLCPGNLLFALKRYPVESDEEIRVSTDDIFTLMDKRRSAWKEKIQQEIPMRINQWKATVEDQLEHGTIDGSFGYGVRVRVILALLLDQLDAKASTYIRSLEGIDEQVNLVTTPGDFLWDSALEQKFPQQQYPFLYVTGIA